MTTKAGLAVAASALLLLTACSHDYASEHFKSTAQVAKIAGWQCDDAEDVQATQTDLRRRGFSSVPCGDGAITLWVSDAKRTELQSMPANALRSGWCEIDGGNWTLAGTQHAVEDAEKQLGGDKKCA